MSRLISFVSSTAVVFDDVSLGTKTQGRARARADPGRAVVICHPAVDRRLAAGVCVYRVIIPL